MKAREYTASLLRGAREFLVAVRGPGQVGLAAQPTRHPLLHAICQMLKIVPCSTCQLML